MIWNALVLLALFALATPGAGPRPTVARPATAEPATRVAFEVRTVLISGRARTVLSDARVEGPAGTDLAVDAGGGRYTLAARLKTDLVDGGAVRIKADVTTRRVVGTSERGLDLFEEDVQSQIVHVAGDGTESLVVMPFGRNPGGDELAIEFLPSVITRASRDRSGAAAGPTIRIADPGPDSWIRVAAARATHLFAVEAELLDGDRVIAAGGAPCRIEEAGAIALVAPGGSTPVAELRLTVDEYAPLCPSDRIRFRFDLAAGDGAPAVAKGWSGVTSSREAAHYDLVRIGEALEGRPGRLRLRIAPLDGP